MLYDFDWVVLAGEPLTFKDGQLATQPITKSGMPFTVGTRACGGLSRINILAAPSGRSASFILARKLSLTIECSSKGRSGHGNNPPHHLALIRERSEQNARSRAECSSSRGRTVCYIRRQ